VLQQAACICIDGTFTGSKGVRRAVTGNEGSDNVLAKLDRRIDCEKVGHGAVDKDGRLDGPSMLNRYSLFSHVHTYAYSGGF
jgi:hypothetical protein